MSDEATVSGGGHVRVVTEAVRETAAAVQRFADEAREIAAQIARIPTRKPDSPLVGVLPGIEYELDLAVCALHRQAHSLDLLASRVVAAWSAYLAIESAQSWTLEALEASLWNAGGHVARAALTAAAANLLIGVALIGPLPLLTVASRAATISPWLARIRRMGSGLTSAQAGGDPLRWFSTIEGTRFIRHVVDNADDVEQGLFGLPPMVRNFVDPRQAREGVVQRWGRLLPGPEDGRVTIEKVSPSSPPRPARNLGGMIRNVPDGNPLEDGRIRIDIVEGDDGVRRAVVYLGGTDLTPGNAEDMPSNGSSFADVDSGFMRAVEMAMKKELGAEGLGLDTPVTFVGYSQGGLAASRLVEDGRWNTAGLLTVGSPGTWITLPDDLPHLAIQHREDPIVGLNGVERAWNRPDAVIYTARALEDTRPMEFLSGHKLELYVETAGEADRATDRATVEERARILANVTGTLTSSSTYAALRVAEAPASAPAPAPTLAPASAPRPATTLAPVNLGWPSPAMLPGSRR